MDESVVFWVIFIFILIVTLGVTIPMYAKHWKATGGVVNYDFAGKNIVYKVYMSEEEITNSLKIMNAKDSLSCKFDFEKKTVLFKELSGVKQEFFYEIQEYDGFSILQLSQASVFGVRDFIPYKLNLFLISKINAEIIPFSQYGN